MVYLLSLKYCSTLVPCLEHRECLAVPTLSGCNTKSGSSSIGRIATTGPGLPLCPRVRGHILSLGEPRRALRWASTYRPCSRKNQQKQRQTRSIRFPKDPGEPLTTVPHSLARASWTCTPRLALTKARATHQGSVFTVHSHHISF